MAARFRVLIAEDEPVFRRVIRFTLERQGFEVEAVENGQLALARLREQNFDFVVTDHQMPYLTGLELLHHVRFTLGLQTLPMILCTAKGLELDSEYLREQYSLTAVLHKPFSPQRLAALILEQQRAEQQRLESQRLGDGVCT
ncbi:response regulator [Candidatus Laterigemmans baculatus]|uniref:response regulator n=1 Tax=Candidatus Laterigemmans baculatus TaxID=2770505 RepID=UPI0013DA08AC|nr:response regulator [Candidatus Laterigemmans baculatus]